MPKTISIDESAPRVPVTFPSTEVELELSNEKNTSAKLQALYERLESARNREAVRTLVVAASSHAVDLAFLRLFPAVEFLQVYGLRLMSLEGVEQLRTKLIVDVDTGKNKRRSLAALARSRAIKVVLHHAQPGDFEPVSRAPALEDLELTGATELPTDERWASPVRSLGLHGSSFTELAELARIPKLRELLIARCSKLERITGDNRNVEWLLIDSCPKLDPASLGSFGNLRVFTASRCRVTFGALGELRSLEELMLEGCKLDPNEDPAPLRQLVRLKKVALSGVRDKRIAELSTLLPRATFSAGDVEYRGGQRI